MAPTRRWVQAAAVAYSAHEVAGSLWDVMNMLSPGGDNGTQFEANANGQASSGSSTFSGNAPLHRFCGLATSPNGQNGFSASGLAGIASEAGPNKIWHYNWDLVPRVSSPGTDFIPMIKVPGEDLSRLPHANANGVGHIIKGWNEPDDAGQAGQNAELRMHPDWYAKAWVKDMRAAQAKGYSQFVAPAIAHDTVWLDFFLKGCEHEPGCKGMVTYLACHRYHNDCGAYKANPDNAGWRDDLSYVVTMYRIMKKYNARGFNIKGIVMDELGCLAADYVSPAPEWQQLQYVNEFYRDTIVAVKTGNGGVIEKIKHTPWIMPRGPDAHQNGVVYSPGLSVAMDGGPNAGDDAVAALNSLVSVAWFSQWPGHNYLLKGQQLSRLGRAYLDACKTVDVHVARRRLEEALGEKEVIV